MTLDTLIMLMGVLMILVPHMGFPSSWDRALYLILGIVVVALGILVRRRIGGYRPSGHEFVDSIPADGKETSAHEE